ncbi:DUF222 domain-containing protein [uncultured Jatrophihabitans sp.]|uniref:DUF222 domain-containing protein n=1 Tax=uncultured Jatrophihabitans sp. TaxID=1610747 RepID=UPI0035CBB77E
MAAVVLDDVLASLHAVVDDLLSLDLDSLSGVDVAGLISSVEVERRRLDAADVRVLSDANNRGLSLDRCAPSLPDLVGGLTRVARGEARARALRATDLGPRRTVTGEPLQPLHPRTADSLAAGEISAAHVDEITRCLGRVPSDLTVEAFSACEAYLVEAARHEDPVGLRRCGELTLARLDPDGAEPKERDLERNRTFGFGGRSGANGVYGSLTTETKAVWQTIVDALASPQPDGDGEPDPRTAGQRRHDAMLVAGLRLLRSGSLPDTGGVPVSLVIRIDADDLERARRGEPGGIAQTAHGDLISAERVLLLAEQCETTEVVLGAWGEVLDYGRSRRLACPAQRKALIARDGGCCFPECTRPASWTEVDLPWFHGQVVDCSV